MKSLKEAIEDQRRARSQLHRNRLRSALNADEDGEELKIETEETKEGIVIKFKGKEFMVMVRDDGLFMRKEPGDGYQLTPLHEILTAIAIWYLDLEAA